MGKSRGMNNAATLDKLKLSGAVVGMVATFNGTEWVPMAATVDAISWGKITGSLANQLDLAAELDSKAAIAHTHTLDQVSGSVKTVNNIAPDSQGNITVSGADGASVWGGIIGTLDNQLDLKAALNTKSGTTHVHTIGQITGAIKTVNGNGPDGSGNVVVSGGGSSAWGAITGTLADQTDLKTALDAKAPKDAPVFSGNVHITGQLTLGGKIDSAELTAPKIVNPTEAAIYLGAGGAFTITPENGTLHILTTNQNATITLPNSVAGKSYTIEVIYGGAHTITFTGGTVIKYSGGVAPVATKVNGKRDIYVCFCDGDNTFVADGGRNY